MLNLLSSTPKNREKVLYMSKWVTWNCYLSYYLPLFCCVVDVLPSYRFPPVPVNFGGSRRRGANKTHFFNVNNDWLVGWFPMGRIKKAWFGVGLGSRKNEVWNQHNRSTGQNVLTNRLDTCNEGMTIIGTLVYLKIWNIFVMIILWWKDTFIWMLPHITPFFWQKFLIVHIICLLTPVIILAFITSLLTFCCHLHWLWLNQTIEWQSDSYLKFDSVLLGVLWQFPET